MAGEVPKLYDVAKQHAEVRKVTTPGRYQGLVTRHFDEKKNGV